MEKMLEKNRNPLPSNEPRMFTDVSERMNPFPTQNVTFFRFNNPRRFATRAECMNAFATHTLAHILLGERNEF